MKGQLTIQNYKSYTKEDHKTWSTLFERQVNNLKQDDKVVKVFWEGISKLKIKKGEIPDFQELNKILKTLSNFEIVAVTGLLDDNIFFQLIKNRKFPVTTWIRKQEQLDYIEQPDIFHDLFGHVPFLIDRTYCDFLVELATLAAPYFQGTDKEMQYAFSRVYWYSVEFGVLQNSDLNRKQIYGAGIISSFTETNKVFEENTLFKKLEPDLLKEKFEKELGRLDKERKMVLSKLRQTPQYVTQLLSDTLSRFILNNSWFSNTNAKGEQAYFKLTGFKFGGKPTDGEITKHGSALIKVELEWDYYPYGAILKEKKTETVTISVFNEIENQILNGRKPAVLDEKKLLRAQLTDKREKLKAEIKLLDLELKKI